MPAPTTPPQRPSPAPAPEADAATADPRPGTATAAAGQAPTAASAAWRRRRALAGWCLPVALVHGWLLAPPDEPPPTGLARPPGAAAAALGAAEQARPGARPAAPAWVRTLPAPPPAPAPARPARPASVPAHTPKAAQAPQEPTAAQAPQKPMAAQAPQGPQAAPGPVRADPAAARDTPAASVATAATAAPAKATAQPPAADQTAASDAAEPTEPTERALAPVYPTAPPPPATRRYRLQRGGDSSWAHLVWQPAGETYSLSLLTDDAVEATGTGVGSAPGPLAGLGATSRGRIAPEGLQPERYTDRRQGRDQRAANFDAAQRTVRGSGGGVAWPFPPGGQDRLSWLLQLAAVLEADPALATPGARIVLPVAGPREATAAWVFEVLGEQAVTLADGRQQVALALRRRAEGPYRLQAEVWLDPRSHHLPLAWQLAAPPSAWSSRWTLLPEAAAGATP